MSDLISRQDAIDVARKCSVKEVTPAYMLIDKAEVMTELMMLPSAHPTQPNTPNTLKALDCISRQDAIDSVQGIGQLATLPDNDAVIRMSAVEYVLYNLPSAQPEIIRCEDCAKCQIDDVYHDYWCDGKKVWKDHFCGYAKRKDGEADEND